MVAPLLLAGLGVGSSLLSSLFGSSAQDEVNAARNQAIQAERGRQQGFDAEAAKINDTSLGRYSNFDTQQAAKVAQLADLFKTPVVTPNTPNTVASLPPVASGQVQREVDMKSGLANDYVNHQADTLANLRSFGDLMGGIGRGQARDAGSISQIGGFKKGSSGVEALELDAAGHAGDGKKAIGDILGGLGKVGLTAGLSGVYSPVAAAGSAPASIFSTGATPFLSYGR